MVRLHLLALLLADMPKAPLLMVAGFVMLGWVLARRQIRMRRRVNQETRIANKAIQEIRQHRDPSLPLSNAPVETQRWQVAMFELQRDLKAELDTRIAVVQTLIRQLDERIDRLTLLESRRGSSSSGPGQVPPGGPGPVQSSGGRGQSSGGRGQSSSGRGQSNRG